jgi:predicted aspartyl protease
VPGKSARSFQLQLAGLVSMQVELTILVIYSKFTIQSQFIRRGYIFLRYVCKGRKELPVICDKAVREMIFKKKIMLPVLVFQLLFLLCCIGVYGIATQDELWSKAVQLAGQNQSQFPANLHVLYRELNTNGIVKNTEDTWLQGTQTNDGQVKFTEVKKLQNGRDVTGKQQNIKQKNRKDYNVDLADLTWPFNPKAQPFITVSRLDKSELKNGQKCAVYDFRCPTQKGDTMVGQAWLNETGIPVAINYTFTPLSKRVWKQVSNLTHDVYFKSENNNLWYPEKIHVEYKAQKWFSTSVFHLDGAFSDFWKYQPPAAAAISTGGKPIVDPQRSLVVPFDYIDGYIFVKVKLNDNGKEYRFLLDTGSFITIISPEAAQNFNFLKQGGLDINDGYTSKQEDLVVVNRINLGEVAVENCGAAIVDLGNLKLFDLYVDGILGSNFLRFFTIRIDYDKHTLTFAKDGNNFAADTASGFKIPLSQNDSGIIFAPFKLPGVTNAIKAEIDTGADRYISVPSHFLKEFKPALGCKLFLSMGNTTGGMYSHSSASLSRLTEFTIGDLTIKNLPVFFEDRNFDFLILGNEFWSHFIMVIDYPRSEMYLLPLKEKTMDTNVNMYGFGIGKGKNGQVQVTGIWKSSAAKRAGLRMRDTILRVTAGGESGALYEECMKIIGNDKYNTVHLFVQRGPGVKEIIITKSLLLPEVEKL